ncbi:hypothetical protein EIP91_007995, partial [Steccherinum ochraceum]
MSFLTIPTRKLSNGVCMPGVGLGCWAGPTEEQQSNSWKWFLTGIQAGYRHLDTAAQYKTEASVGKAIRESGIPRKEFFVTTKIFMAQDENGEDIHDAEGHPTPVESPSFNDVWAGFEKIYASGRAKAIGVSNFSIKTLNQLLTTAKIIPHVNQVESHPYLAQPELKAYCEEKGIQLCAYTPTGYAVVRSDATIIELAKKYNVSPAQVILSWQVMRGVVPTPQSANVQRQKDNITLPSLSDEDFNI